MIERYNNGGLRIVQGDARDVSQTIEPGSCSLAILDGPYGLHKAEWDRVADLPAWYAPHLDDVGRVCGPSASLYVWNTAEGWAALHGGIVARGWTFRALVTWDKGVGFMAGKCDVAGLRTWYDVTEVCGFYQREAWDPVEAGRALRWARLRPKDIDHAMGVACMASRKWLGTDHQAQAPTAADLRWVRVCHPRLNWPWTLDEPRPAFECPVGVSNVWTAGQVSGPERLRDINGETLHPCQKPLAFAERMIRASTRPGERVWVPFGGTCREAVAAQRIARADPAEAREVVTAELDGDGRGYLEAVVRVLEGRGVVPDDPRQVDLFGGGPPAPAVQPQQLGLW